MRVLVACEFSGVVREAFRRRGHDAWSCDLLSAMNPTSFHIQDDVLTHLRDGWDLMIAHPPCTHLAVSGAPSFKHKGHLQPAALEFVQRLMDAPVLRIAVENPIGIISSHIRKPDQIIQPYNFGDDASKSTCLWLKNLPLLVGTGYVQPRIIEYKGKLVKRWGNQSPCGANRYGPSADRWIKRSITFQGIADAMAAQWGGQQA
jgi:hypothetical protein